MKTTIIFILLTVASFSQNYVYTVSWCLVDRVITPKPLQYDEWGRPKNDWEEIPNYTLRKDCEHTRIFTNRQKAFDFYNRSIEQQMDSNKSIYSIDWFLGHDYLSDVKIDSAKLLDCDSSRTYWYMSPGKTDSVGYDIERIVWGRIDSIRNYLLSLKPIPDTLIAQRNCLVLKSFLDLWDEYKKECTAEWRFEKLKRDSVWLPPYSPHWKQWLKKEPTVYEFIDKYLRKKAK